MQTRVSRRQISFRYQFQTATENAKSCSPCCSPCCSPYRVYYCFFRDSHQEDITPRTRSTTCEAAERVRASKPTFNDGIPSRRGYRRSLDASSKSFSTPFCSSIRSEASFNPPWHSLYPGMFDPENILVQIIDEGETLTIPYCVAFGTLTSEWIYRSLISHTHTSRTCTTSTTTVHAFWYA